MHVSTLVVVWISSWVQLPVRSINDLWCVWWRCNIVSIGIRRVNLPRCDKRNTIKPLVISCGLPEEKASCIDLNHCSLLRFLNIFTAPPVDGSLLWLCSSPKISKERTQCSKEKVITIMSFTNVLAFLSHLKTASFSLNMLSFVTKMHAKCWSRK